MARKTPEETYQFIKLVKSGRTIAEANAIMKSATVGMRQDYASAKDVNKILSIDGGLNSLLMTRGDARKIMGVKFEPRKDIIATREEHAAKFLAQMNTQTPLNWPRDGNLIRKGPPNKPKPGSSKGKVARTRFIGHTKTLKSLKKMLGALQGLIRQGDKFKKGDIRKIYKSVKTDIGIKG